MLCPVLVGRDEQAHQLDAALSEAESGHGGVVFVTGEPGIGKSRLVRGVMHTASARGAMIVAGRAVASGFPTPFRPFAEALASAVRAGQLPDDADLDPFRPALGRLVPQWRRWRADGDDSLVFLGEAVLRLLRALSGNASCLLVLEDLHWTDQETLALLEYLADNLASERVLCVATVRAEEAGPTSGAAVAGLMRALETRRSATVLSLARLDLAAIGEMAQACAGGAELPGEVRSLVAERTDGLPFLVEEVLAGLIRDGALIEADGRWQVGDLTGPGVPATFSDAVGRRIDRLDNDARQVIRAAAVLGRRFDWALLGAMTGLSEPSAAAALRLRRRGPGWPARPKVRGRAGVRRAQLADYATDLG